MQSRTDKWEKMYGVLYVPIYSMIVATSKTYMNSIVPLFFDNCTIILMQVLHAKNCIYLRYPMGW